MCVCVCVGVCVCENGFGVKVVRCSWMKMFLMSWMSESGFGVKMILDDFFWDEKCQFRPNLDESVLFVSASTVFSLSDVTHAFLQTLYVFIREVFSCENYN